LGRYLLLRLPAFYASFDEGIVRKSGLVAIYRYIVGYISRASPYSLSVTLPPGSCHYFYGGKPAYRPDFGRKGGFPSRHGGTGGRYLYRVNGLGQALATRRAGSSESVAFEPRLLGLDGVLCYRSDSGLRGYYGRLGW